jgi:hypothetical protein
MGQANVAAMNSAAASAAAGVAAQVPLAATPGVAAMAPAAAHGPADGGAPTVSVTAGSAGGSGGASGGGTLMSAAPVASGDGSGGGSPMGLLPPATPHAAAPVASTGGGGSAAGSASGSGGPCVHPASSTGGGRAAVGGGFVPSSSGEAAPAPIPVSSARAEKDAIAAATRRNAGGAEVQLGYRLAAALNARDMVNKGDFRFVWLTAVTSDGQIVVANSYGLGFIPEKVKLPEQAIMASADESIPVAERARWATYPNLALQGWAAHHDATLRLMIAKREHFAGIDPGVPTKFVVDEDIPASGTMAGRSRLEVLAPGDAARLSGLSDLGLMDMVPPAPVDASPPVDQRSVLWFDVVNQMMTSDPERGAAHLQAFTAYAAHAQELALYRVHAAVHAVEQRGAVADWLYWQRLGELLDEALAGAVA